MLAFSLSLPIPHANRLRHIASNSFLFLSPDMPHTCSEPQSSPRFRSDIRHGKWMRVFFATEFDSNLVVNDWDMGRREDLSQNHHISNFFPINIYISHRLSCLPSTSNRIHKDIVGAKWADNEKLRLNGNLNDRPECFNWIILYHAIMYIDRCRELFTSIHFLDILLFFSFLLTSTSCI